MGVTVATVRVALNTSTGTQDITTSDLGGLTPSAALLIATRGTADGTPADGAGFYAAVLMSGASGLSIFEEQHAQSSSDGYGNTTSGAGFRVYDGTADGVADGIAAYSAFITNGITINITDAFSSGWLCDVTFFAGSDLSVARVQQALGTDTSPLDITGVGFEADNVIC